MFNVEPQEKWDAEEAAEFEKHAAARLKQTLKSAVWAGGSLLAYILCILPLLDGQSSHQKWEEMRKYLLLPALALFLWFVYKAALVYGSWQSSRETRREFGEPI